MSDTIAGIQKADLGMIHAPSTFIAKGRPRIWRALRTSREGSKGLEGLEDLQGEL